MARPSASAASTSASGRPAAVSISRASATVNSITSAGPPPASTSTDSRTSSALPTVSPSGVDMSVSNAMVVSPASVPRSTMVRASSRARDSSLMKAPAPVLTSSTNAPVPSAIFLLMMEEAIRGMQSTVAVVSRRAYSFLSAGARPEPAAQMTPPTSRRIVNISSLERLARQPGMDSILSSVPPVCPRPRPESCGTRTPKAATSGTRGSVILSPTPPVECLSAVAPSDVKSSRSPDSIMARVQRSISGRPIPLRKIAIARADICSSATTPRV